jgi:hypothetical protein
MNHKSRIEERQKIQWANEQQAMNRRKTDNTMAKWFFCSWLVVHLPIVLSVFLLFMTCGSFGHCIICISSIHDLWFIWPLYYLSFFYSWLVVYLAIVLTVFLLFMTCDSFGHCIICLYSVHDLWFIWPLYFLSFFCSWFVVYKPRIEERQKIQWANEKQAMNIRKTDNTMAKWTTNHEQKKDRKYNGQMNHCGLFDHCILFLSSVYDLWFIWPLHFLSFFYS